MLDESLSNGIQVVQAEEAREFPTAGSTTRRSRSHRHSTTHAEIPTHRSRRSTKKDNTRRSSSRRTKNSDDDDVPRSPRRRRNSLGRSKSSGDDGAVPKSPRRKRRGSVGGPRPSSDEDAVPQSSRRHRRGSLGSPSRSMEDLPRQKSSPRRGSLGSPSRSAEDFSSRKSSRRRESIGGGASSRRREKQTDTSRVSSREMQSSKVSPPAKRRFSLGDYNTSVDHVDLELNRERPRRRSSIGKPKEKRQSGLGREDLRSSPREDTTLDAPESTRRSSRSYSKSRQSIADTAHSKKQRKSKKDPSQRHLSSSHEKERRHKSSRRDSDRLRLPDKPKNRKKQSSEASVASRYSVSSTRSALETSSSQSFAGHRSRRSAQRRRSNASHGSLQLEDSAKPPHTASDSLDDFVTAKKKRDSRSRDERSRSAKSMVEPKKQASRNSKTVPDDDNLPQSPQEWIVHLQRKALCSEEEGDQDIEQDSRPRPRRRASITNRKKPPIPPSDSDRRRSATRSRRDESKKFSLQRRSSKKKKSSKMDSGGRSSPTMQGVTRTHSNLSTSSWRPPSMRTSSSSAAPTPLSALAQAKQLRELEHLAHAAQKEPPCSYNEEDMFTYFTWSNAKQPADKIQRQRMALREMTKATPLFKVMPASVKV